MAGAAFDRRLIAPMILGAVLNPVNSSMIAVALIPIGTALGAPPSRTAWLVSGLYLATAIGQPVVGRLVDIFGPRRLYLAGAVLVGVGGAIGVVAPSVGVLVLARVVLGFGTCAGYPAAMYLIRAEATRTGRDSPNGVLTLLAVASQTIAVVGPGVGGLLIGLGGWRTTFAVNIPLALACLLLGARRLPREAPARATGRPASAVDLAGIVLFAATVIALLLFLTEPRTANWYLLAISVAAAAGLAWWEPRAASPFIDPSALAGNLPLLATYARALLMAIVSYAFLYGYTQWLQQGRGLSAATAGLVLMPMFAIGIAVSATTGRRAQVRGKLVVGAVSQVLACTWLLLMDAGSPVWWLIGLAALLGLPQGLNNLANQNAMYHQADPARAASSAGLYRTFLYLGAIGAASANGLFLADGAGTPGLHRLALFAGACSVLLMALTLADRSLGHLVPSADPVPPAPPSCSPATPGTSS